MSKYRKILNKKINFLYCGGIVNSFKLTSIKPIRESFSNLQGKKEFKCEVDWSNKDIQGADPILIFDEDDLDGLANTGVSVCPFSPLMVYKIDNSIN